MGSLGFGSARLAPGRSSCRKTRDLPACAREGEGQQEQQASCSLAGGGQPAAPPARHGGGMAWCRVSLGREEFTAPSRYVKIV